jgi:hypothetical protein
MNTYNDALLVLIDELNRIRDENIDVLYMPGIQHAINILREKRWEAKRTA